MDALRERVRSETRMSSALLEVRDDPQLDARDVRAARPAEPHVAERARRRVERDVPRRREGTARSASSPRAREPASPVEFPLGSWSPVTRLEREHVIVLTGADAERACALFGRGRSVASVLVTALRGEGALAGFLAVGCGTLDTLARERAVRFLAGMARMRRSCCGARSSSSRSAWRATSSRSSSAPSRTSCARR
jgi:hypothetical protein